MYLHEKRYIENKKSSIHPITSFTACVTSIFQEMGFAVVTGFEAETPEYNFDVLNIPKDHPARDVFDTFYIDPPVSDATLLRTHTSPMQVRYAREHGVPCRVIVPGRVYRNETVDATHDVRFHQVEGLCIDKDVSLSKLISMLQKILEKIFQKNIKTRVRPGFFPFVEPGIEIDIGCDSCKAKGCSICKNTGWIEVLGAGMVHPRVLYNMNVSAREYSGYAFGMGVERILMIQRGMPDIRFFSNMDIRFSSQ